MLHSLLLVASMLAANGAAPSSDREAIQSKNGEFIFSKYPPGALARGEQGSVRFRAEADARGNVLGCQVVQSSGFPRLDAETCELIVNHAAFAPAVDAGGNARAAVHDGVVNWRIPGASATAVKTAARDLDKTICKRITKTGSLVAHSRLCMTRREWSRSADRNQSEWGEMQGMKGSSREDQPTWPGGTRPPQ